MDTHGDEIIVWFQRGMNRQLYDFEIAYLDFIKTWAGELVLQIQNLIINYLKLQLMK